LSDFLREISWASLAGVNEDSWNKIIILDSGESIYVYHNGSLRMKVPTQFTGTDISLVGIRSYNTKAEFNAIKVGQFPQNLSQSLLPIMALMVNENNIISIKTREETSH
jgi:hypothetical protein